MRIRIELRKVYVGGGRGALSRSAAYRNEAKSRVRKRYPCECEGPEHDVGYPGHGCEYHGEWFQKRVDRLAAFMRFLDRREREQFTAYKARQRTLNRDARNADMRFMNGNM